MRDEMGSMDIAPQAIDSNGMRSNCRWICLGGACRCMPEPKLLAMIETDSEDELHSLLVDENDHQPGGPRATTSAATRSSSLRLQARTSTTKANLPAIAAFLAFNAARTQRRVKACQPPRDLPLTRPNPRPVMAMLAARLACALPVADLTGP